MNKDRLNSNIESLEKLVSMLKLVANDECSLATIGKEFDLKPQEINNNLNKSFSTYIKKMHLLSNEEIESLIIAIDLPSTRLLKSLFNISLSDPIVFPYIDEDVFWSHIKSKLPDNYYTVVSLRCGYNVDKPMTFEQIGNKLDLTRSRIKDIYHNAISKIDVSYIYSLFALKYIDKTTEIKDSIEYSKAKDEYEKLTLAISKISDLQAINTYIKSNYQELYSISRKDADTLFSISILDLGFSNRLTNALTKNNKKTLNDIYLTSAIEYKKMSNFGKICCIELADNLSKRTDAHPNKNKLIEDLYELAKAAYN